MSARIKQQIRHEKIKTDIYIQGSIIPEADMPYLTFRVTAVALKDMRMQKLRRKFTKSKPGYIKEGQVYNLFPNKHFLNKYVLLDRKSVV